MSYLKLSIDLLPRGAWGNNFRSLLSQKEWDVLREAAYARSKRRCSVCGYNDGQLEAHEVWDFDIESRTQTLKDIIALCTACHGVKHMRNSQRIGYGEQAKKHFMRVNKCSEMVYAAHLAEQQLLFDERNNVLRWKIKADLSRFGGKGMTFEERSIPLIINPYQDINWDTVTHEKISGNKMLSQSGFSEICKIGLVSNDNSGENVAFYLSAERNYDERVLTECPLPPQICVIEVDNYEGTIGIVSDYANSIQWTLDNTVIKTKYNFMGRFKTKFSVEDLVGRALTFRLIGNGGEVYSQEFGLQEYE